jgi:hypothetical protein
MDVLGIADKFIVSFESNKIIQMTCHFHTLPYVATICPYETFASSKIIYEFEFRYNLKG